MSIYIDCTDSIQTGINTGIQRVARNIINNRFFAQNKLGIFLQPVYYDKLYGFVKVTGCDKNAFNNSIGYFHSVRSSMFQFWRFKRLTIAMFPSSQFQIWLDSHWQGISRWLLLWPLLIAMIAAIPIFIIALVYASVIPPKNLWTPSQCDILIIPGSSWWDNISQSGIRDVKVNGGHVVIILYDLIPLSHPQYFSDGNARIFTSNFPIILSDADLVVAISNTTENVLKQYLLNIKSLRTPATSHFLLGADLDLIKHTSHIRRNLVALFNTNKPYLCVGTIEPRKNHTLLLDAFDKIWENNHDVHLCIVGRYGWKSEKLEERITNHPLFGKNLTWFKDLNDTELSFCYKNSKALIFPSIIEGFGLPLIEALHYGCPVMASNIPVFKEIGTDRCAYFSIDSPDSLVAEINHFETFGKLTCIEHTDAFKWITWEDSALQFYTIIAEHFQKSNNPTPTNLPVVRNF